MSEKENKSQKCQDRPAKANAEFSELAKNKSVAALKRLMKIAKDKDAKPEVVVKACETVIAYGYGKPGAVTDSQSFGIKVEVDYE